MSMLLSFLLLQRGQEGSLAFVRNS